MFGRLRVLRNDIALEGLDSCKVQELFSFLLLHRNVSHSREALAALLWEDCSTSQAKKYLRQALWQLQAVLEPKSESNRIVLVSPEWLQLNPRSDLWLDVDVFEKAFSLIQQPVVKELGAQEIQTIHLAVQLYTNELLAGSYREWCLYERDRFQNMHLSMLDKLMDYCEQHHQYEIGLAYGLRILQYDRARERTHRQMMRLYYLAGDRTLALRQYQRCVEALEEDLGVKPERRTIQAYDQICVDHFDPPVLPMDQASVGTTVTSNVFAKALNLVSQLQDLLVEIQQQTQSTFPPPNNSLNEQIDKGVS